jgi:hypothetical protein
MINLKANFAFVFKFFLTQMGPPQNLTFLEKSLLSSCTVKYFSLLLTRICAKLAGCPFKLGVLGVAPLMMITFKDLYREGGAGREQY